MISHWQLQAFQDIFFDYSWGFVNSEQHIDLKYKYYIFHALKSVLSEELFMGRSCLFQHCLELYLIQYYS